MSREPRGSFGTLGRLSFMPYLRAREVIDDCKVAIAALEECGFGPEWRRRWVTVVALLRAVGHVLEKVDAQADTRIAEVIRRDWDSLKTSKPEPAIFWSFIEEERNNVLKEYRFGGLHATGSNVSSISVPLRDGRTVTMSPGVVGSGDVHMHVFDEGPFLGRNQIDVAKEALAWWESRLARTEAGLGE